MPPTPEHPARFSLRRYMRRHAPEMARDARDSVRQGRLASVVMLWRYTQSPRYNISLKTAGVRGEELLRMVRRYGNELRNRIEQGDFKALNELAYFSPNDLVPTPTWGQLGITEEEYHVWFREAAERLYTELCTTNQLQNALFILDLPGFPGTADEFLEAEAAARVADAAVAWIAAEYQALRDPGLASAERESRAFYLMLFLEVQEYMEHECPESFRPETRVAARLSFTSNDVCDIYLGEED